MYRKTGYVLDTHTAVASHVCREICSDDRKCVIASTASPYKFVKSVMTSIDKSYENKDEFLLFETLCDVSKTQMPQAIKDILEADIIHSKEYTWIVGEVIRYVGSGRDIWTDWRWMRDLLPVWILHAEVQRGDYTVIVSP